MDALPDGKTFLGVILAQETQSGAGTSPRIHVVQNWIEELKRLVPTK